MTAWYGHPWIIHESSARVFRTKPVSGITIRLLVCNDVVSMAACRPFMASGSNILIFKVKLGARDGGLCARMGVVLPRSPFYFVSAIIPGHLASARLNYL